MQIKLKLPEDVQGILEKFLAVEAQVYVVGGSVRDLLINREVNDWDFATNLTPQEVQKIFPKNSFYENEYGTVSVVINEVIYEITTFRTEADYDDHRRPRTVAWGKTIEEDLLRRDLTINAIALKVVDKLTSESVDQEMEIIDPYGGIRDLKNKIVRAVGRPEERFAEDALRMMRAIRIACQLEFAIDPETFKAISANSHLLEKISIERVREELLKILVCKRADLGMMLLKESGLLKMVIPELLDGEGMEQKGHHIYDVWTHSIKALAACRSTDPITRLATLLHDVGKPKSLKVTPEDRTFHNHEVIGARIATNIGKRLKLSKDQQEQLFRLVRWHMFTSEDTQTDAAVRRFIRNVTPALLQEMIALRKADRVGSGAKETSWRWELFQERLVEVQKQPFAIKDLKVDGKDVMEILKIKPGKKVGEVLKDLFAQVEKDVKLNERETLLEMIKKYE